MRYTYKGLVELIKSPLPDEHNVLNRALPGTTSYCSIILRARFGYEIDSQQGKAVPRERGGEGGTPLTIGYDHLFVGVGI